MRSAASAELGASRPALHAPSPRRGMLDEVTEGLSRNPKMLPPKYFYDEAGSKLFDEITGLDEYYITRTEAAIMRHHAEAMASAIGSGALLVEFGSGSSEKTRILLDQLVDPVGYVPVDISSEYLAQVARRLRRKHPGVPILPLAADFTIPLDLPKPPRAPTRTVVYFPGSTIGNFPMLEAGRLLARMKRLAGPGGGVLVGFDLLKSPDRLHAAYNDAAGVTARFNLNLLARLNAELGADFDVSAFRHEAPFNAEACRIEMHLVSLRDQVVHLGGRAFTFETDEPIVTEYSHKYSMDAFADLALTAGLAARRSWTDPERLFCVQYLAAAETHTIKDDSSHAS